MSKRTKSQASTLEDLQQIAARWLQVDAHQKRERRLSNSANEKAVALRKQRLAGEKIPESDIADAEDAEREHANEAQAAEELLLDLDAELSELSEQLKSEAVEAFEATRVKDQAERFLAHYQNIGETMATLAVQIAVLGRPIGLVHEGRTVARSIGGQLDSVFGLANAIRSDYGVDGVAALNEALMDRLEELLPGDGELAKRLNANSPKQVIHDLNEEARRLKLLQGTSVEMIRKTALTVAQEKTGSQKLLDLLRLDQSQQPVQA